MENLSFFFNRHAPDEKQRLQLLKDLAERVNFVMAYDTTEEIKLRLQDPGGEWVSYSDEPPEAPLNVVVIRQSDGAATDSPYALLREIWKHYRRAREGYCQPDWEGLLLHAYIPDRDAEEWELAASEAVLKPSAKPSAMPENTASIPPWENPARLEFLARNIGKKWMDETKPKPSVNAIAKYVEGELKRLNRTAPRGDYWDWQTIKKEALTGITGRKRNGKK